MAREVGVERHLRAELRSGLSCVFGRRLLAWLAFGGFFANFSMVTVWTIFLLYGTYQLRFSSFTLGLIFTISSTGGVLGALVAERVLRRFPVGLTYFFSLSGLLLGPVAGHDHRQHVLDRLQGSRRFTS